MMEKAEYTAVPLDETEEPRTKNISYESPFKYDSAFDYRSIAKFNKASYPSKSYFTFSKQTNHETQNGEFCSLVLS